MSVYKNTPLKGRLLATAAMLLLSLASLAQQSINVAGDDVTGSNGSISFSVGEIVFSTAIAPSGSVSQGIQHPYRIVTVSADEEIHDIGLDVYPNPVTSHLVIQLSDNHRNGVVYELVDANGKIIESNALQHEKTELDVNSIQSAFFFLRILSTSKVLKSFKIIKKEHL